MSTGTLDSNNVRVGVTGAWYVAPTTALAPSAADSPLDDIYVNLGFLSDSGTTRTTDRSTNDIKAWQNSTLVRTVVTDASISYKFTLIETTRATVELYTGATIELDGSYTVDPAKTGGRRTFVFDVLDGEDVLRVYLPEAEVTEVGDLAFTAGDPTGYEITIKAYASAKLGGSPEKHFRPSLADIDKARSAPGDRFPAEATVTASDSANAGKLTGLDFVAKPTTAWTTGQQITVGGFAFSWSGTAWKAGAAT